MKPGWFLYRADGLLKYLLLLLPHRSIHSTLHSLSHFRSSALSSLLRGRRRAPSSSLPRSVAGSRLARVVSTPCPSLAPPSHRRTGGSSLPPSRGAGDGSGTTWFCGAQARRKPASAADLRRWSGRVLLRVDPVPHRILGGRRDLLLFCRRLLVPPLGVNLCHGLGSAARRVRTDPVLCGPGTPSTDPR